jgi:hypothetical protein
MTLENWLWVVFAMTAAVHLAISKFIVAQRALNWKGWENVVRGNLFLQIYSFATPAIFVAILILGFWRTYQGWWYLIAISVVWILPPFLPTPGLRRRLCEQQLAERPDDPQHRPRGSGTPL